MMPRETVVTKKSVTKKPQPKKAATKKKTTKKRSTKKRAKKTERVCNVAQQLETLLVPIESLNRDPANARLHGDRNLQAIAASLRQYGQDQPLVVQKKGRIIRKGNGRHEAAMSLGWTHIAAVVVDESDVSAISRAIADNRTAELAEWDASTLAQLLQSLKDEDAEAFEATGFDAVDLAAIVETLNERNTNVRQDTQVGTRKSGSVFVQYGDVWQCGRHRVMCGDCRDADHVAQLFGDDLATLAFTSPPYAAQREYDEESDYKPVPPGAYVAWFHDVQYNVLRHLHDRGSWIVNIKPHCENGQRVLYVHDLVAAHVRQWSWLFVEEYMWRKQATPGKPALRLKNGFEPVYHFARNTQFKFAPQRMKHEAKGMGHHADAVAAVSNMSGVDVRSNDIGGSDSAQGTPGYEGSTKLTKAIASKSDGTSYPDNVLNIQTKPDARGHNAAFPVQLPAAFVQLFTDRDDIVYDPFGGSGTTMIACEQLDRSCLIMDVSPNYVDEMLRRFCEFVTDDDAVRMSDGASFRELDTAEEAQA